MKKLVVNDKGIGIAEMLFEDQERAMSILIMYLVQNDKYEGEDAISGTYPIPPDFPEYVEVRQTKYKTRYAHDDAKKDKVFLRFVDKQEQRNGESQEELWGLVQRILWPELKHLSWTKRKRIERLKSIITIKRK